MTVIFYDEGEHDAGFVGFRVATTIASDDEYRQKYYSLSDYTYSVAKKLAHAQNEIWKAEAEEIKRFNKLYQRKKHWGKNIIVEGLRAYIGIENKIRRGEKITYFYPAFYVTKPGYGKGDISFRTSVHGYKKAYQLAVAQYSRIHDLSTEDRKRLLGMIPCETVFSEYLLGRLRDRGYSLDKYAILDKLI